MAICVSFSNTGMNADQYAETLSRLESAGASQPEGQLYHVCFGDPGSVSVIDIFESQEAFDDFKDILTPILEDLDLNAVQPQISEIHNLRTF